MASRGSSFSAFQQVYSPRCVLNSSFSIRSILDLPEENAEKCAGPSSNDSPADSYSVSLPLVPRVVRPMVHNYDVRRSTLGNWEDLRLSPYGHHWGHGAFSFREQAFPMGEYKINSIQISGFPLISSIHVMRSAPTVN